MKIEKLEHLKLLFKMFRTKLKVILAKLIQKDIVLSQEEIDIIYDNFNKLSQKFYKRREDIFQVEYNKRKELFEISSSLNDFFKAIHKMISSCYTKNISNDLIAQVNSLSYKEDIREKFLKKLEQRMKSSVSALNKSYENIKKHVEILKKTKKVEELEKEYFKENEEIGKCFLSCNNFIGAMFEEDCLCICFNVSRSDLTIVDPTTLKINKIFPTIISGNSFLESVKYSLEISPESSGGFKENEKGEIVKGLYH